MIENEAACNFDGSHGTIPQYIRSLVCQKNDIRNKRAKTRPLNDNHNDNHSGGIEDVAEDRRGIDRRRINGKPMTDRQQAFYT